MIILLFLILVAILAPGAFVVVPLIAATWFGELIMVLLATFGTFLALAVVVSVVAGVVKSWSCS